MFWRKKHGGDQGNLVAKLESEEFTGRARQDNGQEHEFASETRAPSCGPEPVNRLRTWPYRGIPGAEGDCHHALDALISVMRALAEHPIRPSGSASSSEELVEPSATHLTWLADLEALRAEGTHRAACDWREIARFVESRRIDEAQWVRGHLEQFRATVQSFASSLGQAFERERVSDIHLSDGVERLLGAVAMGDQDVIREEALRTTRMIETTVIQRQARQAARVLSLAQCVDKFCSAVDDVEASVDGQTKLYTRPALVEHLSRLCDLSPLLKSMPCMMILDLEGLGIINRQHGEVAAERVVRATADTLASHFPRKEDFVARYYGGTFAIVLPDVTLARAEATAVGACRAVAEQASGLGSRAAGSRVSASVGVSRLIPGETVQQWVARAEHALSVVKRCGGDRVAVAEAQEAPPPSSQPATRVSASPHEGQPQGERAEGDASEVVSFSLSVSRSIAAASGTSTNGTSEAESVSRGAHASESVVPS
jgi:diguanylate cyclase (GGDEF)-like protein